MQQLAEFNYKAAVDRLKSRVIDCKRKTQEASLQALLAKAQLQKALELSQRANHRMRLARQHFLQLEDRLTNLLSPEESFVEPDERG